MKWFLVIFVFHGLFPLAVFSDEAELQEHTRIRNAYQRAVDLLEAGIVFEAIHNLELFVRTHPDNDQARLLLARSLYRVKRNERAAEEASHVLRVNPDNMEARRLLTRIRIEMGMRLDHADPAALLAYARLCASPGSYDRAAIHYRKSLSLADDTGVHLEFARMLYWAGSFEESSYHYERFLEIHPDHDLVLSEVGRVYNSAGKFPQAIAAFESALKHQPDDLDIQFDLIRALMWSGRMTEADDRLDHLIRRQLGGETPFWLKASMAGIQGLILDEHAFLQKVIQYDPGHAEALERLGVLDAGSLLKAARLLGQIASEPEHINLRIELADLYEHESRFREAIEQLDHVLRADPGHKDALRQLKRLRDLEAQWIRERVESFRGIRERERRHETDALVAWLERNAGDMKSRYRLAELYLESGDHAQAIRQLEWLEAANPGNMQVMQTLQRIRSFMQKQNSAEEGKEGF